MTRAFVRSRSTVTSGFEIMLIIFKQQSAIFIFICVASDVYKRLDRWPDFNRISFDFPIDPTTFVFFFSVSYDTQNPLMSEILIPALKKLVLFSFSLRQGHACFRETASLDVMPR